MSREDVMYQKSRLLHNIVMATSEDEIERLSELTAEFLAEHSERLGVKEYSDSLQALRVFTWKAKHKLQEGI